MGAYLHAYQAAGTGGRIHNKDPIFKLNGIFRTVVGTDSALIAEVDAVVARSRKAPFNTQH